MTDGVGDCRDLADDARIPWRCCDSCHDDIAYDFPLMEYMYRGRVYELCCWMAADLPLAWPPS